MKGWQALKKAINNDGMLGWVQPIGASPETVTQNMTEVYGAASLMLVGEQLIRYFEKNNINVFFIVLIYSKLTSVCYLILFFVTKKEKSTREFSYYLRLYL